MLRTVGDRWCSSSVEVDVLAEGSEHLCVYNSRARRNGGRGPLRFPMSMTSDAGLKHAGMDCLFEGGPDMAVEPIAWTHKSLTYIFFGRSIRTDN